MKAIEKMLAERELPEILKMNNGTPVTSAEQFEARRKEIKRILQEKEYGKIPPRPDHMSVDIEKCEDSSCAGKSILRKLKFNCELGSKSFSFPATSVIPVAEGRHPAFVHINFNPNIPDKYQPTEEIIDHGYAVFTINYLDVTSDDGDFKNGCAPFLCPSRRAKSAPGKIAMWAWAAMRVMDYIQTLDCIDVDNVAVIGHSRLGKTALVAGAFDDRFKYVISNDSGCSGAALSRGKIGESIATITRVFPFWFCPAYTDEAPACDSFDFDQHFLMALSAPRHLLIGSAEEDLWADPKSEFLGLAAVNEVYALYGMKGLVHSDEVPTPVAFLGDGDSCYHVRHGKHYLSREDWLAYIRFIDSKIK